MEPSAGPGPNDWLRDGDNLGRSERRHLDALNLEFADLNAPEVPAAIDRDNRVSGSPILGRDEPTGTSEPFAPSYSAQVEHDEEQLRPELVAQLAALEARQAELRRRIGASIAPDPEFDSSSYQDHDHPPSLASPAYGPAEVNGFEMPIGGRQSGSLFRRVVMPVFFALALPMSAGAVSIVLFSPISPSNLPDVLIPDNGPQIVKTEGLAAASSAAVGPTAEFLSKAAPQDSTVAAGASPSKITPRDSITDTESPIAVIRVPDEGGVTMLRRRESPSADVARGVTLIRPAIVDPARPVASAPPVAKANTVRFAPLDYDAELLQSTVPPEVIALAPAHFPPAAQLKALQPIGFAATSKAATIEQEAPSQSATADVEMWSQPTQTARTTVDVNMRAGPTNDEPVVTVVLAEAPIEVVECKAWCEVVFEGQRGWIHNKFVDHSGAATATSSQ